MYVIGEEGIEHELKSLGIAYAGGTVSDMEMRDGRLGSPGDHNAQSDVRRDVSAQLLIFDSQDPEDRVFVPSGDYSSINQDPSIGAVLCGFDAYVST